MAGDFYIKGVKISCCRLDSSVAETLEQVNSNAPDYICVTDVGNLVNAYRNSTDLKYSINNSLISLPDGKPISILAKLKGIKNIDRVAGPDFMEEIFRQTSGTNLKHFFLGDTEEIHKLLIKKISEKHKINIAGSYSPEFGNWDDETEDLIISKIKESSPDFIWVSLGGGRQEIWMKNNFRKLNKGVMIGVGAAFRFYVGKIKRAPVFMQKLGLEWLIRLIQQPKKMFGRYAATLPFFLIYSVQEIFSNSKK